MWLSFLIEFPKVTLFFFIKANGRICSPGFNVKYCTYLGLEAHCKDIVALEIIDKREVNLKSTVMEKVLKELQRG